MYAISPTALNNFLEYLKLNYKTHYVSNFDVYFL